MNVSANIDVVLALLTKYADYPLFKIVQFLSLSLYCTHFVKNAMPEYLVKSKRIPFELDNIN